MVNTWPAELAQTGRNERGGKKSGSGATGRPRIRLAWWVRLCIIITLTILSRI